MAFNSRFVFTDPVAAQQATAYAQLEAQERAAQEQAFNERIRTGTQGRISQQNAEQQRMMTQSQMAQQAAEREKDRALQREGYGSSEKVAGIVAGQRGDILKAREAADAAANKAFTEENWNRGSSYAESLNNPNTPAALKKKLMESGDVVMGPDGVWRSRHSNPNAAESIGDIRQRVQGIPGSMGVGGMLPGGMMTPPPRSMVTVTPMPSPGPRPSSSTDFPVQPRASDMTVPMEPSPFETPGFKVFKQSDLLTPKPPPVFNSSGSDLGAMRSGFGAFTPISMSSMSQVAAPALAPVASGDSPLGPEWEKSVSGWTRWDDETSGVEAIPDEYHPGFFHTRVAYRRQPVIPVRNGQLVGVRQSEIMPSQSQSPAAQNPARYEFASNYAPAVASYF